MNARCSSRSCSVPLPARSALVSRRISLSLVGAGVGRDGWCGVCVCAGGRAQGARAAVQAYQGAAPSLACAAQMRLQQGGMDGHASWLGPLGAPPPALDQQGHVAVVVHPNDVHLKW